MSNDLIERLELKPLKQGGYYRHIYESDQHIQINDIKRPIGSAFYFYLESDDFVGWHRTKCDEIWQFYTGSDLSLHIINEKDELRCVCLGDIQNNDSVVSHVIVPADTWIAIEVASQNTFALACCTCFPGYDKKELELGKRDELTEAYPKLKEIIHRLTRD